jgi:hypothetical protein
MPSSRDSNTQKDMGHDVNNNNESETVSDLARQYSNGENEEERDACAATTPPITLNCDPDDLTCMLSSNEHHWKEACQVVKDLTIFDCFEGQNDDLSILALTSPPTWIQSVSDLTGLEQHILQRHVQLVSVDSEWWHPPIRVQLFRQYYKADYRTTGGNSTTGNLSFWTTTSRG